MYPKGNSAPLGYIDSAILTTQDHPNEDPQRRVAESGDHDYEKTTAPQPPAAEEGAWQKIRRAYCASHQHIYEQRISK